MRVWDIPVHQLCDKHLVAQHHEIHCIYSIITNGLKGFAHHPEVIRWRGHLLALELKHFNTVIEMRNRGINHNRVEHSVDTNVSTDLEDYPAPWQPVKEQVQILKQKGCGCDV